MGTMVDKEYEADDPLEMVGVQIPSAGDADLRDMALCFAEEFIRGGWSKENILKMFRDPFYQGPYLAWRQKGDAFVEAVIEDALGMWRPCFRQGSPKEMPC
jgi:hypothetical protein